MWSLRALQLFIIIIIIIIIIMQKYIYMAKILYMNAVGCVCL